MKGKVDDWKQAVEHAKANAQDYEDKFQALHTMKNGYGHGPSTGQWKGTEYRRQAWNLVSASIAEALRLEALPIHKA